MKTFHPEESGTPRESASIDPQLAVSQLRTLVQVLAERVAGRRLGALMMAAFGTMALLLAALGIYGVIAYLAAQRRREIGIRVALGARAGQVLRLVMRRGAWLTGLGIGLGLPVALMVARLLSAALRDVVDPDRALIAMLTLAVTVVALIASLVPARRAARADPMASLRGD